MFDNSVSMFRPVALGTAAENIKLGSRELLVSPHEKLGFTDGETVEKVDALDYQGQNLEGKEKSGQSFVSGNTPAIWLPEPNRKTPPTVRRGERVQLYQFGSNEELYWRCLNLDENLRRLETVVFAINANPSESQDGIDPENMYFIEWSSHTKTITLSTSQANGEFCTYDIQIDAGNGKIIMQDNLGNYGFLNSKETHIKLQNQLGSFFELNKRNINGYAPQNIFLKADLDVNVKAKRISLDGGGSVFTLEAGGTTLVTPKFSGSSG
ncbi:hypothetical protein D3C76_36800 [compost metagenome]